MIMGGGQGLVGFVRIQVSVPWPIHLTLTECTCLSSKQSVIAVFEAQLWTRFWQAMVRSGLRTGVCVRVRVHVRVFLCLCVLRVRVTDCIKPEAETANHPGPQK